MTQGATGCVPRALVAGGDVEASAYALAAICLIHCIATTRLVLRHGVLTAGTLLGQHLRCPSTVVHLNGLVLAQGLQMLFQGAGSSILRGQGEGHACAERSLHSMDSPWLYCEALALLFASSAAGLVLAFVLRFLGRQYDFVVMVVLVACLAGLAEAAILLVSLEIESTRMLSRFSALASCGISCFTLLNRVLRHGTPSFSGGCLLISVFLMTLGQLAKVLVLYECGVPDAGGLCRVLDALNAPVAANLCLALAVPLAYLAVRRKETEVHTVLPEHPSTPPQKVGATRRPFDTI